MKRIFEIMMVIGVFMIAISLLYQVVFINPSKNLETQPLETKIFWQGRMKYIVFMSGSTNMEVKNYTLDSLEFVYQTKFLGQDSDK